MTVLVGQLFCPYCGHEVEKHTGDELATDAFAGALILTQYSCKFPNCVCSIKTQGKTKIEDIARDEPRDKPLPSPPSMHITQVGPQDRPNRQVIGPGIEDTRDWENMRRALNIATRRLFSSWSAEGQRSTQVLAEADTSANVAIALTLGEINRGVQRIASALEELREGQEK